jgi:hypothetical protein
MSVTKPRLQPIGYHTPDGVFGFTTYKELIAATNKHSKTDETRFLKGLACVYLYGWKTIAQLAPKTYMALKEHCSILRNFLSEMKAVNLLVNLLLCGEEGKVDEVKVDHESSEEEASDDETYLLEEEVHHLRKITCTNLIVTCSDPMWANLLRRPLDENHQDLKAKIVLVERTLDEMKKVKLEVARRKRRSPVKLWSETPGKSDVSVTDSPKPSRKRDAVTAGLSEEAGTDKDRPVSVGASGAISSKRSR